jgi:hypothetical protein
MEYLVCRPLSRRVLRVLVLVALVLIGSPSS